LAYIGNTPAENYASFLTQTFSVTATASYTLDHAVSNENDIRLVINNVVQQPGSGKAYTASGTTLTLSEATASTDVMYCVYLGRALQTVNPPNNSVNEAQLNYPLTTFSSTGIDDNADATAITIDSSERVGIDTASTTNTLEITGSGTPININSTNDEVKKIQFENSGVVQGFYGCSSGTPMRILNGSATELIRINSSGKLGIGKTPSNLLDLAAGIFQIRTTPGAGVWGLMAGTDGSSYSLIKISSSGTNNQNKMQFFNTNGEVGSITTNGSATQYETSSDYRLKENVSYDFDATTRLKQLKPARFNFIADADTTVDGFIAHEVSSIVPEAISGTKDAVQVWEEGEELPEGVAVGDNKLDDNGNTIPDYQGIDQSKLVPLLVKTIQELEARITALETTTP